MTKPIDYINNAERYNCPVKPKMPIYAANKTVMSLKILAETAKVSTRAREMDFLFLKKMSNNYNCPEFNGYILGTIHKYVEIKAIHPNLRQKQCTCICH